MAAYLRVEHGVAVETFTPYGDHTLEDCFAPDIAAAFKPRGSADVGWRWDGNANAFIAPPAPLPPDSAALTAYAKRKRAIVAGGGFTVNVGTSDAPVLVRVKTDAEGWASLGRATTLSSLNPSQIFPWVQGSETFELSAAQIQSINLKVNTLDQDTRAVLADALVKISSGAIVSTAEIDALAWPVNS
jgi:hypothetical protein